MSAAYFYWAKNETAILFLCIQEFLSPASGRSRDIIKCLPYMHVSIRQSHFYINLNISFICKDIFTKFEGKVYGYENMYVKNFGLILKNKMAVIANCFKIIKML